VADGMSMIQVVSRSDQATVVAIRMIQALVWGWIVSQADFVCNSQKNKGEKNKCD
jgi:hypothetical protein